MRSEPAVVLDSIHGNSVIPVASILKNRSGAGTNPSAWTSKTQTGGDRVAEESKPEIRPPLHPWGTFNQFEVLSDDFMDGKVTIETDEQIKKGAKAAQGAAMQGATRSTNNNEQRNRLLLQLLYLFHGF